MKMVHYHDPGFFFECSTCHRKYTNHRSYQNHILKHKKQTNCSDDGTNTGIPNDSDSLNCQSTQHPDQIDVHDVSLHYHDGVPVANVVCDSNEIVKNLDLTDHCAKWILKTSETRSLTRTATIGVVQDVSDLISDITDHLKTQVQSCLKHRLQCCFRTT
jgi:hypothetical protein